MDRKLEKYEALTTSCLNVLLVLVLQQQLKVRLDFGFVLGFF